MTSTDVVVVLPGIMGSTLGRTDRGRLAGQDLVWAPSAGAVWRAVTSLGGSITDFRVPDGVGDEHPGDGVEPVGLMPDVHAIPGLWTPVKGYDRLLGFLRALGYREQRPGDPRPGNLLPVPYDWRLSNRFNGARLAGIVEPALDRWRAQGGRYADARLVFVCHSMGGLVARWYVEMCGGAGITRKLITLGTPWRGAAKTVQQLVNGVPKGIGPLRVDLTGFSRSLPSAYQLLPEYACIESGRGGFTKTTETTVPELDTARVADAMAFHTALQAAEAARPDSAGMAHVIVGTRQPTWTTIRFDDGRAVPLDGFGADNDYGDATVPLTGAIGHDQPMDTPLVRRIADQHGHLQRNQAAFDEIEEVITAVPVRRRADRPVTLRVAVPDLVLPGEDLPVSVDIEQDPRQAVRITVTDETGKLIEARQPRAVGGHIQARFSDLPAGALTVTVAGPTPASPINPVTATTIVWDAKSEV